jgi:hypothetical protein
MSTGLITLNVVAVVQIKKLLNLSPFDNRYLKGFISALLTALMIILIKWLYPPLNFIGLAAVTLFSFISFAIVLLALGLSNEDKEFLRSMISKN